MPSNPDAFVCFTPYGAVDATFPEDERGVSLDGQPDAIEYVEREIRASTNIDGISLTTERLAPTDLLHFCQRPDGLLVIAPPWFELQ